MGLYFCRQKGCTCKSLHYRMQNGMCQGCGHRSFSHFSYFNKHVLNPIQRDGYSGDGRRAMFTLKNEVLDTCLLRRTKETRAADMELPPRFVSLRYVRLHPVEGKCLYLSHNQFVFVISDFVPLSCTCRGFLSIALHGDEGKLRRLRSSGNVIE